MGTINYWRDSCDVMQLSKSVCGIKNNLNYFMNDAIVPIEPVIEVVVDPPNDENEPDKGSEG